MTPLEPLQQACFFLCIPDPKDWLILLQYFLSQKVMPAFRLAFSQEESLHHFQTFFFQSPLHGWLAVAG